MAVLALGLCVFLMGPFVVEASREYYLGAVEVDWDYAPSGRTLVPGTSTAAQGFIEQTANRVGRVYKKVIYKQYTDHSFSEQVPGPDWLGIVGPILKAQVGETLMIHFHNFASKAYSVHPHGLHYEKQHEGALYIDKTSGFQKLDDVVPPGGEYTYVWDIVPEFGPAKDDPDCIPWVYHSHGPDVPRDTNSGLIGVLLTCKPGSLDKNGNRRDVDKEFVALLKNFDENRTWYTSNIMHSMNGFIYANGPRFEACVADRVAWYVIGMGSETDIHGFTVDGETLTWNSHRKESVGVFATSFVSAEMVLVKQGEKLVYCDTTTHFEDGMEVYIDVRQCNAKMNTYKTSGTTRKHFLSIEEVIWDYAPSGMNKLTKQGLVRTGSTEAIYYQARANRIGSQYIKALFYAHTDSSFKTEKLRSRDESHLGSLGPTLRVEVGDILEVVLFNNATRPFSFLPRGLIPYGNIAVNSSLVTQPTVPREKRMYRFYVPEESAPSASDPPCITFMYHSAVDHVRDVYSGLVGPLLVCKKGSLDHEGKQKGVSRELKLFLSETDENKSWYIDRNIDKFCVSREVDKLDLLFIESNIMRSINGFGFGNLHGLSVCKSQLVAWHLLSVGGHTGVHSVYFHDLDFIQDGNRQDTIPLFPGSSFTFITKAGNVGRWEIVCRNIDHYKGGMSALYDVSECGYHEAQSIFQRGKRRRYFIGAVEREWNYAPSLRGLIKGGNLTDPTSNSYRYLNTEPGYIGPKYLKALFREFTDTSFRFEKQRTPEEEHLGILGPAVKAEVGDEIEIVFKNLATRPYSMHAHIVKTDKANEGTFYSDDVSSRGDNGVPPNAFTVYQWRVPSGPGPNDPPCISSLYYSAHDQSRDLYSGLVGPIIICRKGVLDDSGGRKDVDKEFMVLFSIFDENESLYIGDNIHTYAPSRNKTNPRDPAFVESNMMHSINGLVYQAVPGITMAVGEKIAWYLLGFGSTKDVHTVHFHGQTVLYEHSGQHTLDVLDVFPESGASVVMQAINPGVWLLHCHVNDHMEAGMETIYTILPKGSNSFIANVPDKRAEEKSKVTGEPVDEKSSLANKTSGSHIAINQNLRNGTKGKEHLPAERVNDDVPWGDKSKSTVPEVNSKSDDINVTHSGDILSTQNDSNSLNREETHAVLNKTKPVSDKTKSPLQSTDKDSISNITTFLSDQSKSSHTDDVSFDTKSTKSSVKVITDSQSSSQPTDEDTTSQMTTSQNVVPRRDTTKRQQPPSRDSSVSGSTNITSSITKVTEIISESSQKGTMVTESTKTPEDDDTSTTQGTVSASAISADNDDVITPVAADNMNFT
ncbi:hephaestin-like [Gigantopelta aegis]|uniref:hephaestin-like n=1 Tax=Gigantopelta aegis TaxID=1735272 RepID=UPI001B88C4B7|nr:hephaestin-like [Gigantopelta aegis]